MGLSMVTSLVRQGIGAASSRMRKKFGKIGAAKVLGTVRRRVPLWITLGTLACCHRHCSTLKASLCGGSCGYTPAEGGNCPPPPPPSEEHTVPPSRPPSAADLSMQRIRARVRLKEQATRA